MPRPAPRPMPEMPGIEPWVPVAPTMPDLPGEIPWPPDFDWGDGLSPWYNGNDGRPYCYNDFASRLMRLISAVATLRVAAGLRPMYPPFDLRFMVATPTIVGIAALWLATMWNTATIGGAPESFNKTFLMSATDDVDYDGTVLLDGSTYTFYNYITRVTEKRQTFGVTYGTAGRFWGSGFIFDGVDIPHGAVVSSATLYARAFAASSGRKIKATVFGYQGGYSPTGPGFTDIGSFLGLHNIPTTEKVLWDIASTSAGEVYNPPAITAVAQEILDAASWDDGDSMVLFVSDLADKRGDSYDHSQLYSWAVEETTYVSRPSLNIQGMSSSGSSPTPPITPLASTLDCGIMQPWLGAVENVLWPILRS